jgi:hypothetical protein
LDLGYGGFGEAELGGFLGIVNEELHSRSSAKRSTIQQKANLATGLDLTYDLNTYKKI